MSQAQNLIAKPALPGVAVLMLLVGNAGAQGIRLWASATVVEPTITLADVADLDGLTRPQAETLSQVVIGQAPRPGGQCTIHFDELRQSLRGAGVSLATLRLSGAARCVVRRAAPLGPIEPETPLSGPTTQPADGEASDAAARVGTLHAAVRDYVRQDLASVGGEVRVRFSRPTRGLLGLAAPAYRFEVRRRSDRQCGLVSFEVDVIPNHPDGNRQRVELVAEVSVGKSVVVARRAINRGATIGSRDVTTTMRWFDRLEQIGLCDLAAAVGQQAGRFVPAGEMLRSRDVRPVPLVRRGELVTVYSRSGKMVIKTVARALGEATFGQPVEVRNESSGQQYVVQVTGPQTAEAGRSPR